MATATEGEKTQQEEELKRFRFTVDPIELKGVLRYLMSTRKADGTPKPMVVPMVWGGFGVGKTQIIGQIANEFDMRICALHLPQYAPTDIKGFPIRDTEGRIVWVASSYLPQQHRAEVLGGAEHEVDFKFFYARSVLIRVISEDEEQIDPYTGHLEPKEVARFNDRVSGDFNEIKAEFTVVHPREKVIVDLSKAPKGKRFVVIVEDKAILFLDELSAAAEETQAAGLQLVLDRRIADYLVPRGTPIAAAGNHEKHGAYIRAMSAPLANRMCHVRLVPSVIAFVRHVEREIADKPYLYGADTVTSYLLAEGDKALWGYDKAKMKEGDLGTPSPRMWFTLLTQLEADMPRKLFEIVTTGHVGSSRGSDFIEYWDLNQMLPDPEKVLDGKETAFRPEHDHFGIQHRFSIMLGRAMKRRYDAFFAPTNKVTPEWEKAVIHYCRFLMTNMRGDIQTMGAVLMLRVWDMTAASFRVNDPVVVQWVRETIDIHRAVRQGSARR